jgi:hypothetical protein
MRDYHERLHVPIAWWFITVMCVLILGTELIAGYDLVISVAIYAVIAVVCAATLLHWGGAVVSVRGGELRATRARVSLAQTGEVQPLDETQTRAMRGPRADPDAYMLIRPYLKQSVYVALTGADAAWPYLLICTRHPLELAEAIEKSRAELAAQG